LQTIDEKEKRRLEEENVDITMVPSKLVITRKAGGRRKVRIVACANYIEKDECECLRKWK